MLQIFPTSNHQLPYMPARQNLANENSVQIYVSLAWLDAFGTPP
jgi:hypothetical protein